MKKNLLACAAAVTCLFAAVPSVSAFTVNDFIGKKCTMVALNPDIVTVTGTASTPTQYQRWGHASYDCEVVAGPANNQIIIKNFLGICDMPMTLDGGTVLSISANNKKFPVIAGEYEGRDMTINLVDYYRQTKTYVDGDGDGKKPWNLAVSLTTEVARNVKSDELSIPSTTYGLNKVCDVVCKFNRIDAGYANGGYGYEFVFTKGREKGYMILSEFDLFFYDAGQTVTQNVDGAEKTYGLRTDITGNTFSISNLMDLGVAYRGIHDTNVSLTDLTVFPAVQGSIDGSNIAIPAQVVGGTETGLTIKEGSLKYASGANGSLGSSSYALWLIDMGYTYDNRILASGYEGDEFLPITGKMVGNGAPFHANHQGNYWCTNGGTTTTHTGSLLELGNMAVYSQNTKEILHYSDGLTIMESENEITHMADIKLEEWSLFEDSGLSLNLTTKPVENLDLVENYELYLIDGARSSITGQELDSETGLKGALKLDDFKVEAPSGAPALKAVGDGAMQAVYKVPVEKLRELGWGTDDANDEYTVFLKANYTKESDLRSTFHNMTTTENLTPTGISIPFVDNSIAPVVKSGVGYVEISGCAGHNVEIFTPQGVCIYSGAEGRVAVPQGICVVRAGNTVTKVAVR